MKLELKDLVVGKEYDMATEGIVTFEGTYEGYICIKGIKDERYTFMELGKFKGCVLFDFELNKQNIDFLDLTEIKTK